MPETRYDRPTSLECIRLPGPTTDDVDAAREELVRHIREGLAGHRYVFGDVLPTAAELQEQYALPEPELHDAIRELRRAGLLQLHDDYRDTYILDPGPQEPARPPGEDLAERVTRLEALYRDLAARVEAAEASSRRP
ncbi:GntR family transcriptional regulator [Streptomyces sp. NPDC058739]|uniref:GntR family transcriptional regulator n=1 Tax=Streptomyces sp. NPDC058739 TaxID=3346618 RepID=UPI0036A37087